VTSANSVSSERHAARGAGQRGRGSDCHRNLATRVYQTRHLAAKAEPETVVAEEPVEISPRTGKPKRKYKRRDLAAED
jgi:hypothetical protein